MNMNNNELENIFLKKYQINKDKKSFLSKKFNSIRTPSKKNLYF